MPEPMAVMLRAAVLALLLVTADLMMLALAAIGTELRGLKILGRLEQRGPAGSGQKTAQARVSPRRGPCRGPAFTA